MKTINFYNYALNAINVSIKALDNKEDIISYYGNPSECTIESYFASQINQSQVFDSTDEFSDEELIGNIDDLREDFETAREDAYQMWVDEQDEDSELTYDIHFNDNSDSNNLGFHSSLDYCKNYIEMYNGTNDGYFEDYRGGIVSIVCHETNETVYQESIR